MQQQQAQQLQQQMQQQLQQQSEMLRTFSETTRLLVNKGTVEPAVTMATSGVTSHSSEGSDEGGSKISGRTAIAGRTAVVRGNNPPRRRNRRWTRRGPRGSAQRRTRQVSTWSTCEELLVNLRVRLRFEHII
eukprot:3966019-Pyramimonas_sp.AAC.1